MERSPRWLATAPLWVVFVVQAVLYGGGMYLFGAWGADGQPPSGLAAVIAGVFFGLVMTWFVGRQRKRAGGARRMAQVAEAVKAGQLPDGADPAIWEPALARQERTYRRVRVWGPLEFGAFTALAVALAVTGWTAGWVFAAVLAGFLVGCLVAPRRRLARIRRMRAQLREVAGSTGA